MKIIVKLVFWLIGVIVVLLLVGFFLPRNEKVERTVTVNARPEAVYNLLNDLTTYDKWMPWNQLDTQWKVQYAPQTSGVGAWYKWESKNDKVGKGKLTITESTINEKVITSLEFEGFDKPSVSGWVLKPAGAGTELTWYMNSDMGNNPAHRWMGILMDKMLGPQFDIGLRNIAAMADKGELKAAAVQEPSMTVEETITSKKILVYVTDSAASTAEITQKFMKIIPVELGGFLKKKNLQMTGPPLAWYNGNKAPFIFDIAAQVNKLPPATEGRIKTKEIPVGKAVVVHFYGPYELSWKAYPVADTWIKEHHKIAAGAPYEVYMGDPGAEKDPYKVLTDVVFPVK
jgi:effector-binding domain-containing protein